MYIISLYYCFINKNILKIPILSDITEHFYDLLIRGIAISKNTLGCKLLYILHYNVIFDQ